MGANAKRFLNFRMEEENYSQIPDELRSKIETRFVDYENEDFSNDELWYSLKKKSDKAFKDLKNREYDLRHDVIKSVCSFYMAGMDTSGRCNNCGKNKREH